MENREWNQILSFADAAAVWNLDDSALRHAVAAGRLIPEVDCRKYGKQWVVQVSAMCRLYGVKKYQQWLNAGSVIPPRRKQPKELEGQIKLEQA